MKKSFYIEISESRGFDAEFEAHPQHEDDGIGSYEYWGAKCYDSRPYISCEQSGIEWDKSKYSADDNELIEKYLEDNYAYVEGEFIDQFVKDGGEE